MTFIPSRNTVLSVRYEMYRSIHSLNTETRAKTVNMRIALQSFEPQLTAPWSTQNPPEFLQTKGPPLSPWQPPSRVPGTPAHSIALVMPLPSVKREIDAGINIVVVLVNFEAILWGNSGVKEDAYFSFCNPTLTQEISWLAVVCDESYQDV